MRNLFITLTMSFLLAFNSASVFAEEAEKKGVDWVRHLGWDNVERLENEVYSTEGVQQYSRKIRSDLKALGVSENGLDRYIKDFEEKYLNHRK